MSHRARVSIVRAWADRSAGRQGVEKSECMVRDTFMASVTWYEWEEGVRDHVDKLMARGLDK